MNTRQYLLYFSHSWFAEHVDLNIAIWDHLWAKCRFLVDGNAVENPPYYVSRIEDLIKRSDCLLAFAPPSSGSRGSSQTLPVVSPYVLFETVLAERARIPRLVIVDRRAQIDILADESPLVRYLSVDFSNLARDNSTALWNEVSTWLASVESALQPKDQEDSGRAMLLLPAGETRSNLIAALESCLRAEGYTDVGALSDLSGTEALRHLRQADLLIADIGSPSVWDFYGMAHALAVPTIRCAPARSTHHLPSIVRGYEAGFEHDIIRWSTIAQLTSEVGARARAIRAPRLVIDSLEEGRDYFETRRHLPSKTTP